MKVFMQRWVESEAGWGIHPDGYSLHKSRETAKQYIDRELEAQHKRLGDKTPEVYVRPDGEIEEVEVRASVHKQVEWYGSVRYYDEPSTAMVLKSV